MLTPYHSWPPRLPPGNGGQEHHRRREIVLRRVGRRAGQHRARPSRTSGGRRPMTRGSTVGSRDAGVRPRYHRDRVEGCSTVTRPRREPPQTVRFLSKDGTVIETASLPGWAYRSGKAVLKAVPRGDRRAVITCEAEHVLAVVRRDGLVVAPGGRSTGWAHSPDGWHPLVSKGVGPERHLGPSQGDLLRLICVGCCGDEYDVDAADVPTEPSRSTRGVSATRRPSSIG